MRISSVTLNDIDVENLSQEDIEFFIFVERACNILRMCSIQKVSNYRSTVGSSTGFSKQVMVTSFHAFDQYHPLHDMVVVHFERSPDVRFLELTLMGITIPVCSEYFPMRTVSKKHKKRLSVLYLLPYMSDCGSVSFSEEQLMAEVIDFVEDYA